jgi:hypothetical protein
MKLLTDAVVGKGQSHTLQAPELVSICQFVPTDVARRTGIQVLCLSPSQFGQLDARSPSLRST